jgi:hypothetical protein
MSVNATPQSWFDNIKKTWSGIAELAAFILGIVGTFLLPPPGWASGDGQLGLVRLGQFIVAVLCGLIFILVRKWDQRKHVARWAVIAASFLVFAVAAYFGYQRSLDARTCKYDTRTVVIGSAYTAQAQSYVRDVPGATCEGLLEDFAGKAEDIWTKDSINNSRYILALTFIGSLPLFTVCIIAVVQMLSCLTGGKVDQVAPAPQPPTTAAAAQPDSTDAPA